MLTESLNRLAQFVAEFEKLLWNWLPDLVGSVLLVVLGVLAARFARGLARRLFAQLGNLVFSSHFRDRVDQRQVDRTAALIGNILFWTILIFSMLAAAEVLGLPVYSAGTSGMADYLPGLLGGGLILVTGYIVALLLRDLMMTGAAAAGIAHARLVARLVQYATLLAAILIAADQIGINVSFLTDGILLLAGALLFGAAFSFGLGAGPLVNNILSAYSLQKIYSAGQRIRVGGHEGVIVEITPVAVILETKEGRLCLPAKQFLEKESMLVYGGERDDG